MVFISPMPLWTRSSCSTTRLNDSQPGFKRALQFLVDRLPHLVELGCAFQSDRIEPTLDGQPEGFLSFLQPLPQASQRACDIFQSFLLHSARFSERPGNRGCQAAESCRRARAAAPLRRRLAD